LYGQSEQLHSPDAPVTSEHSLEISFIMFIAPLDSSTSLATISSSNPLPIVESENTIITAVQHYLILSRQTSLDTEKYSRDGLNSEAHIVVKNVPFILQVTLVPLIVGERVINFKTTRLEAKLTYDSDSLSEVPFQKTKPLDYTTHSNERGDQVTLEVKIKVLTSQHEDSKFRVRIRLVDTQTSQHIHEQLELYSHPIKVVSKPDAYLKKKKTTTTTTTVLGKRKRASPNDKILDILTRIEDKQKQQDEQFKALGQQSEKQAKAIQELQSNQLQMHQQDAANRLYENPVNCSPNNGITTDNLEQSLLALLQQYYNTAKEERPTKIRRIIKSNESSGAINMIKEISKECSEVTGASGECNCSDCPYKQEVDRVNEFYMEFLKD